MAKRISKSDGDAVGVAPAAAAQAEMPQLPIEMFTPLGMLALADLLPVLIAYIDRDERYRFCNRAYAEWLERPPTQVMIGSNGMPGKAVPVLQGPALPASGSYREAAGRAMPAVVNILTSKASRETHPLLKDPFVGSYSTCIASSDLFGPAQ